MTSVCKHAEDFLCPFCGNGYHGGLCGHVGVPKPVDCEQCRAMYGGLARRTVGLGVLVVAHAEIIAGALRQQAANLSGFGGKCKNKEEAERLDRRVAILRKLAGI